ncbi:MAG: TonB family protein [Myxococcales bacterium]|nr:TonB family protein [Myxococcota bacterium]MDW8281348.1 TonB family protein [Myxococcales bacterium]
MRISLLPWILSTVAHAIAVCAVAQTGDTRPARAPVTVEIVHRNSPPLEQVAGGASTLPMASPASFRPRARPAMRPARARPVAWPQAPVLPAEVSEVEGTGVPLVAASALPTLPASLSAPSPAAVRSDSGSDLGGYLGLVNQAVASRRHYPPLAVQLALEGTVELQVAVNRDGSLAGRPVVLRSSGHDLLDEEAVRMAMRAAPFPPLPAGYPDAVAVLRIPVRFHLD